MLKELARFYFRVGRPKKAYLERVSEKDENYIRAYYRNFEKFQISKYLMESGVSSSCNFNFLILSKISLTLF